MHTNKTKQRQWFRFPSVLQCFFQAALFGNGKETKTIGYCYGCQAFAYLYLSSLTGFKTNVVALDGRKIGIKRDEITWPGMKMRVKGEGMPDYRDQSRKGNLIITFDVQFPRGKLDENSEENILGALKVLKYSGGKEGSQPILYNGLQGF